MVRNMAIALFDEEYAVLGFIFLLLEILLAQ
jgi:hypothetical protein